MLLPVLVKGRSWLVDDKPTRYVVLAVAVATWFFLLYLLYLAFPHVLLDQNALNQLISILQTFGIGGATFFLGRKVGNGNGKNNSQQQ